MDLMYLISDLNCTINDDCFNIFPRLPDNSIDLILTDPPYNTTACSWECAVDIDLLFSHYKRILKENGTIVVFGNNPFTANVIVKNLDIYRYSCVWVKPNSTSPHLAKTQPMRRYEDIMIFYKKKNIYNPIMSEGTPYNWSGKRSGGEASRISFKDDKKIVNSGQRYPTNVFEFPQERGLHPTQKPVSLFEYIIKLYTNENMIVLDSFMGCGTTAISCINTGRNYVCIEKNTDIFNIANARIASRLKTGTDYSRLDNLL